MANNNGHRDDIAMASRFAMTGGPAANQQKLLRFGKKNQICLFLRYVSTVTPHHTRHSHKKNTPLSLSRIQKKHTTIHKNTQTPHKRRDKIISIQSSTDNIY
jgi:hypothetical protein